MSVRAMWKGVIAFGDHQVPVKLYAAARDARTHFRMLDADALTPVSQKMVDPRTGEPVEDVRRGFEASPGTFVMLTDEELDALAPDADRAVEVRAVLAPDAIDPARYDRPYWLGPDGDEAGYGALAAALAKPERVAIVRWAMRKRHYTGALRAEDGALRLSTLRPAEEVLEPSAIAPPEASVDAKEAKLAEALIEALADDFDVSEYRPTYQDAVAELVAKKARGETVEAPAPVKAREPSTDLEDALRESLKAATRKKKKKSRKKERSHAG